MIAMNVDSLTAYSAACGFFGRVLRPGLDVDLLRRCAQECVFDAWPLAPVGTDSPAALALIVAALTDLDGAALAAIEDDNAALFVGPENPVPMWESVWTTEEGLLFADCTQAVVQDFARFGFATGHGDSEPADHLAYELSFLAALLARAAQAAASGDATELRRHVEAAAAFHAAHPVTWAARCLTEIEQRAGTDFYRGVSGLCRDTLASLGAAFGAGTLAA